VTQINVDGDEARSGLMALLITVVELLLDAMEREAVRRMESGRLADEEIERLGEQLARLEDEIAEIKRDEGIEDEVDRLRGDLDGIVGDAVRGLDVERETMADVGDERDAADDADSETNREPTAPDRTE